MFLLITFTVAVFTCATLQYLLETLVYVIGMSVVSLEQGGWVVTRPCGTLHNWPRCQKGRRALV